MMPKHVAISLEKNISIWAKRQDTTTKTVYDSRKNIINKIIKTQVELNIPIVTVFLLSSKKSPENFGEIIDSLTEFFQDFVNNEILNNQIKVSFLGKWYNLPSRLVESIKYVMDETKSYDRFFLNFCIQYDGQSEIVDACKLIGRKIEAERLDSTSINESIVKENLYTSYFIAPDLVIINGGKKLSGFLLWDISEAMIYFTNKHWPEFTSRDLHKAIDLYKLVE